MKFSVLTAVYNPEPEHLRACLQSVSAQAVGDRAEFEHVLVDDGSTEPSVGETLAMAGPHCSVHRRTSNGGIVAASNDALQRATGDWIVLLDHDDMLTADALPKLRTEIEQHPEADVVYSDHAVLRPDGRIADPYYKPDFSPERLRHSNYVLHLVAIRTDAVRTVGGFTPGSDGAQDHDLLLKLADHGYRFHHLPDILALWRQSPASVSSNPDNKPTAFRNGVDAVQRHLERCGVAATAEHGDHVGTYRIRRDRASQPVSVVIPTNGSKGPVWGVERTFVIDAIRSIANSDSAPIEFVVVYDSDTPNSVLEHLGRLADAVAPDIRLVEYSPPFNFSDKINAGVRAAAHDLLLLLNDDTEMLAADSVTEMATLLAADDRNNDRHGHIGAVGARLHYPDGTLQHIGHLYHGEFMHACIGWDAANPGPANMAHVARECAGVTAAALMTTRAAFDRVGGFDTSLPLHFNDVDFCLKLRSAGYRIIYTPDASWHHFEGRTRTRGATMDEWRKVTAHWPDQTPHDPYANPNLVPKRSDWLELPGRRGAPPFYLDDSGRRRFA